MWAGVRYGRKYQSKLQTQIQRNILIIHSSIYYAEMFAKRKSVSAILGYHRNNDRWNSFSIFILFVVAVSMDFFYKLLMSVPRCFMFSYYVHTFYATERSFDVQSVHLMYKRSITIQTDILCASISKIDRDDYFFWC